jgi:hypothetical protein
MNTEIVSVEAHEIPIEQAVERSLLTSLEKMNITKKFLEEKRDECLELKLDGQNKEAYTIIRETRLNMKTRRVAIEKICKKGREDATKTQKAWIAVQNDWTEIVSAGEDYLSKLEEQYEMEAERIKSEAKRKQEESFILRQSELTKMGAQYIDGNFVLNDISFEAILIKEADDEVWNESIKNKYYDQYLINEAVRLAEEKVKAEAAEKLRIEQEEFEKQKKELREAQEKLQLQQQAEKQKIRGVRVAELKPYIVFIREYNAMLDMDEEAYQKELSEIKIGAEQQWEHDRQQAEIKQKEAEERRIAQAEEDKRLAVEAATRKEKERIEKELADAKLKKEQEDARKAEELAQASDKDKWNDFVSQLNKLSIPDMRSGQYRKKIQSVNRLLGEIKGL